MNSRCLVLSLVPVFAFVLGACAGEGADESSFEQPQHEQQFPVQADLIDDIRNAFNGGTGAVTPNNGTGIPPHGDPPLILRDTPGPYAVQSYDIDAGRVYYPVGAQAPFAGLSLCGGFLNSGDEMLDWGQFYASWGIVTVIAWTGILDLPFMRAWSLADGVSGLQAENASPLSPIYQKMSGRYGTTGYSMGGGGTTIAAKSDSSHKVTIGMAPWAPEGDGLTVPALMMCGDADIVADCSDSELAYNDMAESVPKMWVMLSGGVGHLDWFGPDAAWGMGGAYGLAFAKLFLEGDQRWKATLLGLGGGFVTTNIR